jgi:large subunit ribosomal protein L18
MARGKLEGRDKRKARIRKKVSGTAERPRLTVFRSNKQIYAQVVDDRTGQTLACASSVGLEEPSSGAEGEKPNKTSVAERVGQSVAGVCLQKGIQQVVFDRSGYIYHGRIKALADGARKGGLSF